MRFSFSTACLALGALVANLSIASAAAPTQLPAELEKLPDCAKQTLEPKDCKCFNTDENGAYTTPDWECFCNNAGPFLINFVDAHKDKCTKEEREQVMKVWLGICSKYYK